MNLQGKTAVITGGACGIGRCIAESFAKEGAGVAIIDTNEKEGLALQQKLATDGINALFFRGDISDKETLECFAEQVTDRFGTVDYLINNACVSKKGILSGCGYEDFEAVLKIGTLAPYYLTKLFLQNFSAGGVVVNISSTRANMSQPDTESYTAAKGGISALTHALAVSLGGRGIRVNSVSPGWIDTGEYHEGGSLYNYSQADKSQHPAGRVGDPRDIAEAVLFLCSEKAGFITGQDITVDGGMTKQMIYSGDHGWELKG